ncbi:uroporphyrinogen-III synthase [Brachybacterium sp. EE-P12]|uniref:uroporphyrinogen-III synthase n=1 Tax=Brachybacterium sp. EE-P12 TaxID=2306299 RepID=UPI000F08D17D|nr:uroporphyrinogen-III synthase [Brachybacterium sp. EE-P12]
MSAVPGRSPAPEGSPPGIPPAAPRPVLVTRPAGRGEHLVHLLAQAGLHAEHVPLTHLVPTRSAELETARAELAVGVFTHLVVTSRTAAECLADGGATPVPEGTEVVAVGEGTAAALARVGIRATRVADGSGAALVAAMPPAAPGAAVLFPASAAAARTVPEGLRDKGYRVREVEAYRPAPLEAPPAVSAGLPSGRYAAIVLTSPMIARHAAELGVHPSTAIVTIGEPTSAAARTAGLAPACQAAEPSDEALVAAVRAALDAPSATAPDGPSAAPSPSPSALPPKESR